MESPERAVREEIADTIERAGFDEIDPDAIEVEVTPSLRRRLGDCQPVTHSDSAENETAGYRIRIAERLVVEREDDLWRDTVRHEVAHAVVFETYGTGNGIGHGPVWKDAAKRAGANPQAACEIEEDFDDVSYVLACPNGCDSKGYLKRSKRIKQPWQYACTECETKLISYDVDEVPSDPSPGYCYVSSIPWTTPPEGSAEPTARYVLACPEGCWTRPYQQRSTRVKFPWQYACPECETSLIAYDGGNEPADPEPGTCYVASIGWDGPRYTLACPNGCFENHYAGEPDEVRNPSHYLCPECETKTISHPVDERPETPAPGTRYDDQGNAPTLDEPADRSRARTKADGSSEESEEHDLRPIGGLPGRPLKLTEVVELCHGNQFELVVPPTVESLKRTGSDSIAVHDVIFFRESSISALGYDDQAGEWLLIAKEDNAHDRSAFEAVGRPIVNYRGYNANPAQMMDNLIAAYGEAMGIDNGEIEAILDRYHDPDGDGDGD